MFEFWNIWFVNLPTVLKFLDSEDNNVNNKFWIKFFYSHVIFSRLIICFNYRVSMGVVLGERKYFKSNSCENERNVLSLLGFYYVLY
jgi:hypothetical protein